MPNRLVPRRVGRLGIPCRQPATDSRSTDSRSTPSTATFYAKGERMKRERMPPHRREMCNLPRPGFVALTVHATPQAG
jgi:hypothetical protein